MHQRVSESGHEMKQGSERNEKAEFCFLRRKSKLGGRAERTSGRGKEVYLPFDLQLVYDHHPLATSSYNIYVGKRGFSCGDVFV